MLLFHSCFAVHIDIGAGILLRKTAHSISELQSRLAEMSFLKLLVSWCAVPPGVCFLQNQSGKTLRGTYKAALAFAEAIVRGIASRAGCR